VLLELARQYADIIQAIEVERFRSVGASYEFRALITLHDGSQLFVKDYLFVDGTRKYAYHWQDREGRLRCRWDNAPHWPEVTSYPHHQHVGSEEVVTASDVRTSAEALQYIREQSRDS
jgi:Family of unknown function (DUF6516)